MVLLTNSVEQSGQYQVLDIISGRVKAYTCYCLSEICAIGKSGVKILIALDGALQVWTLTRILH